MTVDCRCAYCGICKQDHRGWHHLWEGKPMIYTDELRAEFVKLLTEDSRSTDGRRKDFNQAIFDPRTGRAVYTLTDLHMVMHKFDMAVKRLGK